MVLMSCHVAATLDHAGTFKGLQQQLPYIKALGADAIWMSPPYKQAEGGYHGADMLDEQQLSSAVRQDRQLHLWTLQTAS